MLNAINTKILLAILAALTVIGGARHLSTRRGRKDSGGNGQSSATLQVQKDDNDYLKQENEALRKQVEADKKQHSSAAAHEGKTWKTYIP